MGHQQATLPDLCREQGQRRLRARKLVLMATESLEAADALRVLTRDWVGQHLEDTEKRRRRHERPSDTRLAFARLPLSQPHESPKSPAASTSQTGSP